MKYLLFCLFILPAFLYAQQYTPLAVEGAQWVIYQNAEADSNKALIGYVIKGDSVVNGTAYKKVFYREYEYNGGPIEPPYVLINEEFHSLIRDDISEKKVYALGAEQNFNHQCQDINTEKLWYDFSVDTGEDLVYQCVYDFTSVDTILLDSTSVNDHFGYDRQTYYGYWVDSFGASLVEPYFIEGIGSTRGLYDPAVGLEYTPHGAVHLVDYCIGSDQECFGANAVNKAIQIPHTLSPNPVAHHVNIKLDAVEEWPIQMMIYDQMGRQITSVTISSPSYNLNCSSFLAGIYNYTFLNKQGQSIGKGRFVKQ